MRITFIALNSLVFFALAPLLPAQPKPGTDVLMFPDGEKLVGELLSATASVATFQSNMGFRVTVSWKQIQELHSDKKFAVIPKDLILRSSADAGKVPQGTIQATNQNVELKSAPQQPAQTIPVATVSNVLDEKVFNGAFQKRSFFHDWKGTGSVGFGLTESTVNAQGVQASVAFARAEPSEDWLTERNKTSFLFTSNYSNLSAPGLTLTVNTLHSQIAQEHYVSPKWYLLVGAQFDHDGTQGLTLLQSYGAGGGVTPLKTDRSQFDVYALLGYMKLDFTEQTLNRNLFGGRFGMIYTHTFKSGIMFNARGSISPSWNERQNFFAGYQTSLVIPFYRGFGIQLSSNDFFINNPVPYFKQNSFQTAVGLSYTKR